MQKSKVTFSRRGNLRIAYEKRLTIANRFGVSVSRVVRVRPSGNYYPFRAVSSGDPDYVVLFSQ